MSTYIISDLHGCDEAFRKALKKIKLKKEDFLYLLGDFIAKGPDSQGVLDTIIELKNSGFNLRCLLGDHELMFLNASSSYDSRIKWLNNGGKSTVDSFKATHLDQIDKKYFILIESFERYIEHENFILVHAGIDMKDPDPYSKDFPLFYMKEWKECYVPGWLDGRKVIHGHTPMKWNDIIDDIANNEEIICIDNGSYLKRAGFGNICVLKLETMQIFFQPVHIST